MFSKKFFCLHSEMIYEYISLLNHLMDTNKSTLIVHKYLLTMLMNSYTSYVTASVKLK